MWVDLLQLVEGLKRKDGGLSKRKNFCLQYAFGLLLQYQFFPESSIL